MNPDECKNEDVPSCCPYCSHPVSAENTPDGFTDRCDVCQCRYTVRQNPTRCEREPFEQNARDIVRFILQEAQKYMGTDKPKVDPNDPLWETLHEVRIAFSDAGEIVRVRIDLKVPRNEE